MNKTIIVKCPQCETSFSYYTSEFRPFCSERCKNIDLGLWLSEGYSIEGDEKPATMESEGCEEKTH